jgi:hypothetical protein
MNKMQKYQFVDFKVKEKLITEALEEGLGRSLNIREIRYVKWFSECDYETSGLLLDWIKEITR